MLGRLALALRLDEVGVKKVKIRRLADYHDGSLQQADELFRLMEKVSYREQQSRSSPSVWVVAVQILTFRRRQSGTSIVLSRFGPICIVGLLLSLVLALALLMLLLLSFSCFVVSSLVLLSCYLFVPCR